LIKKLDESIDLEPGLSVSKVLLSANKAAILCEVNNAASTAQYTDAWGETICVATLCTPSYELRNGVCYAESDGDDEIGAGIITGLALGSAALLLAGFAIIVKPWASGAQIISAKTEPGDAAPGLAVQVAENEPIFE
jgi:hypothetical protein